MTKKPTAEPIEPEVKLPRMRLSFGRRTCLELERKGKESRVITIESEGLAMAWRRTAPMLAEYNLDSSETIGHSIIGLLRVNARAYLNNSDAVAKLMEAYLMAETGSKNLTELNQQQLTEHYNKLAAGIGRGTVKGFKSKGEAIKRIEALGKELGTPTAEQHANKATSQAAATKRLAGLDRLRESKEEGGSTNDAGKSGSTKEASMAQTKSTKKAPAKKAPAKKAPAKKAAATEKKPRGQGIGAFCIELILKGKSNEEVADAAQKKFGSNTTASSVSWYRNKLKNEGKL